MEKIMGTVLLLVAVNCTYAQKTSALTWLAGTWKINTGQGYVVETWEFLNDSTLEGRSVFVKSINDTILQESLELAFRKGQWTYTSAVQGQNDNKPVSFNVIFIGDAEFICENRLHDFPQRITYRRIDNRLFASIEGRKGNYYRKHNFDFTSG